VKTCIFILNSAQDRRSAETAAQALEEVGHTTWVEWRDLATGARWELAVRRALAESGLLVLILTRWSAVSSQVEDACKVACSIGLPIVTLCFDETAVPSGNLEPLIAPEFWLDCYGGLFEKNKVQILAIAGRLQAIPHQNDTNERPVPPAAEDPFPYLGSLADRPGMFCCQCGADNPDFLALCRRCGTSMLLDLKSEVTYQSCTICTSINPVFASFCRVCGSNFQEPTPARAVIHSAGDAPPLPEPQIDLPSVAPCGLESVGQRVGQWLLTRLLGRGGQGSVFEAIHIFLRTSAALKVLHVSTGKGSASGSNFDDSLRRGVRGLARLDSPYVAKLLDFGEADFFTGRRHYLISELVHGPSLRDILPDLARQGADNLSRALRIFRQLCLGVQAAHEVSYFDAAGFEMIGVRHGDIKPANVLLAEGETVKLIDFLLFSLCASRSIQKAAPPPSTQAYGTPGYMAPEQMGRGEVTIATDIYSLGATLLQMLTLALPSDIGDLEDEAVLRCTLSRLNPDANVFGAVLHRCLAPDPVQRFASAQELLDHLPQI